MLETIFRYVFAAVLGGCLGSFANVLAIRFHESSSLMGRSKCPACDTPIKPRHLVPLFSWLALRGRCADCNSAIHVQYPLVEVIAACLAVIAASRFDPLGDPVFYGELLFGLALLVMSVMDLRWKELPLELMSAIGVMGFVVRIATASVNGDVFGEVARVGLAASVAIAFFGLQWAISKGKWLGNGDVWFALMMALVLGWPGTPIAMYLAYLVGGIVVACLVLARVIKRGMRVPFAPALAIGTLLAMWFGVPIANWISYVFA